MPHDRSDFFYLEDGAPRTLGNNISQEDATLPERCDVLLQQVENEFRALVQAASDAVRACMSHLPQGTVGFVKDADRKKAHGEVARLLTALEAVTHRLAPLVLALERPESALARALAFSADDETRTALRDWQTRINDLRGAIRTFHLSKLAPFCIRLGSTADLEHLGATASPAAILSLCAAFDGVI